MKLLVAKSVKASEKKFVQVNLKEVLDEAMILDNENTLYEVIHPDKNEYIKPYFDIDDKTCSITLDYLYDNIIPYLNSIFNCHTKDWAVSDDSRPAKSSFHIILTNFKTTIIDMIRLKDYHKTYFQNLNIDCSVYSKGYQKFRMVHFKHETDKCSKGLKPISFSCHNETIKHIISVVEDDAKIFTFQGQDSRDKTLYKSKTTVRNKHKHNNLKLSKDLKKQLLKYQLISDFINKNGLLIADIQIDCPWNKHKNNHRYLTVNPNEEKIILKCHSEKCTGKSKIVYEKQMCFIDYDSENDSKESTERVFNIDTFNQFRTHKMIKKLDEKLAEKNNEFERVEKQISDSYDKILNIDTDLKSSVIQKEKQKINKIIKKDKIQLKKIKTEMNQLSIQQQNELLKLQFQYFEKFHAKIMIPFVFLRKSYNDIHLYNKKNFEDAYQNLLLSDESSFLLQWFKQPNIKTYEKLDFLPPPVDTPQYIYNTFDGFEVEKFDNNAIECDIEPILNHFKILVNHNTVSYEYVLNYFAHLIQNTGELPLVSLVFRSEKEGVGKNLMFEHFIGYSILGSKYVLQTTDIDKIIGRFSMINNKLLVILDETKGKDTFLNNEKIKSFITSNKIAWEKKGVDGFNINNFARLLFFTNNDTPISIPYGDRRFACFDCSNEVANNRAYFAKLCKILKDPAAIYTFYMFLKNRDLTDFDIVADRPETDFYKELREHSIPCVARFLMHYIGNDGNCTQIYGSDLYEKFNNWCNDTNRNVSFTDTRFGRELKKYQGISKRRTKQGNKYTLDFNAIQQCMIEKQYLTITECMIDNFSDSE